VRALRHAYDAWLTTIDPRSLVFLDESGASIKMTRTHGRSARGSEVFGTVPSRWGDTLSVIGAISPDGFQAAMTLAGAVDGPAFLAYVRNVLAPTLKPHQVVVMDNLSVHKVKGVRETIEATGARLVYLPPYSPDLNPIEKCWAQVKRFLRGVGARTLEHLERAVATSITLVGATTTQATYRDCGYAV